MEVKEEIVDELMVGVGVTVGEGCEDAEDDDPELDLISETGCEGRSTRTQPW